MTDLNLSPFCNHGQSLIDPSSTVAASAALLEAASTLLLFEGCNNLQVAPVSTDGSSNEDDGLPLLPPQLPDISDGQDATSNSKLGEEFAAVKPEDISEAVDSVSSEGKWRGKATGRRLESSHEAYRLGISQVCQCKFPTNRRKRNNLLVIEDGTGKGARTGRHKKSSNKNSSEEGMVPPTNLSVHTAHGGKVGAKSVVVSMLRYTGDFDDELDKYIAWWAQQRTINRAIQNEAAPQYTSVYYGSLAEVE